MIFYIYSVYDPEVEGFDGRLNLAPFEPKDMAEQYRRSCIKMNEVQKAEADGKKVILMGTFDDVTGKIEQTKLLEIFTFKNEKKNSISSQVEEGEEQEEKQNA